jgi:hypothetical protein
MPRYCLMLAAHYLCLACVISTQYYVGSALTVMHLSKFSALAQWARNSPCILVIEGNLRGHVWNSWLLPITLALAGPESLLLTLLVPICLLQCLPTIAGKRLSILTAAECQTTGPLAFGGLTLNRKRCARLCLSNWC